MRFLLKALYLVFIINVNVSADQLSSKEGNLYTKLGIGDATFVFKSSETVI